MQDKKQPSGQPGPPDDQAGHLNQDFLRHALTPSNVGMLPKPEGYANPQGVCGDSLELYLRVRDGVISDARFMPDGCLNTVACGSALTVLIKGATLEQAATLSAEKIEAEVGGLDREHRHCAALALATLMAALRDYHERRRRPWQGLYGRR